MTRDMITAEDRRCPRCGRTTFAVRISGYMILDTDDVKIAMYSIDKMASTGRCTYCDKKIDLKMNEYHQ